MSSEKVGTTYKAHAFRDLKKKKRERRKIELLSPPGF